VVVTNCNSYQTKPISNHSQAIDTTTKSSQSTAAKPQMLLPSHNYSNQQPSHSTAAKLLLIKAQTLQPSQSIAAKP
jgi:hypothetical protein